MREIPPIKALIAPAILIIFIFFTQLFYQNEFQMAKFEGNALGTTFDIQVIYHHKNQIPPKIEEIEQVIERVNQSMSTYQKTSELSRFNQSPANQPFLLSQPLEYVFKAALALHQQSNLAFDVTVGPLVNLWGFGPERRTEIPNTDEIKQRLPLIGSQHLKLVDHQLIKDQDGLYCDLSAIAKGYAVDEVGRFLTQKGYQNFWIEIGGEVLVKGKSLSQKPWKVGIEHPSEESKALFTIVHLKDMSMATSGDYRNFIMDGDIRRSHTIDPRTGYPITHELASVTVLHPENMWADGWATAINVLGPDEGMKLADQLNLAVMMIVRVDGKNQYQERRSKAYIEYIQRSKD